MWGKTSNMCIATCLHSYSFLCDLHTDLRKSALQLLKVVPSGMLYDYSQFKAGKCFDIIIILTLLFVEIFVNP